MTEHVVELHDEPYRHYKVTHPDTGRVTWSGRGKQRIQSVTDLLDPDQGGLLRWAVGRTVVAAEEALRDFLPETQPVLARSVLDFPGLMSLTGAMPDDVRDAKADLGTEAHSYLALRLTGWEPGPALDCMALNGQCRPEYGYREAIDGFLREHGPEPAADDRGLRVERAVGSFERCVAGTYDAQVWMAGELHRIDLKSSNSLHGKNFAQLAAYEDLAVQEHGESRSDFLTIVHIDPLGGFRLVSMPAYGRDADDARAYFEACVVLRRAGARLSKLVSS